MNSVPGPKTSSIRVAECLTELPPRERPEQKPEGCGGYCTGTVCGAVSDLHPDPFNTC